jgi:hypothetical protein
MKIKETLEETITAKPLHYRGFIYPSSIHTKSNPNQYDDYIISLSWAWNKWMLEKGKKV